MKHTFESLIKEHDFYIDELEFGKVICDKLAKKLRTHNYIVISYDGDIIFDTDVRVWLDENGLSMSETMDEFHPHKLINLSDSLKHGIYDRGIVSPNEFDLEIKINIPLEPTSLICANIKIIKREPDFFKETAQVSYNQRIINDKQVKKIYQRIRGIN